MGRARSIHTVLMVDDDARLVEQFARFFRRRHMKVFGVTDAITALDIARRERPQLAIIDLRMPGMPGLDVVRRLAACRPAIRIAAIAGYVSEIDAAVAFRAGAALLLQKPVSAKELMRAVEDGMPEPRVIVTPTLRRAKWLHASRVLADCNNNVSHAAKRLGMSRTTLQRLRRRPAPTR